MFTNRLFSLLVRKSQPLRSKAMKTMILVLLLTIALSACAPAVSQAPMTATTHAPSPTEGMPTSAPTMGTATPPTDNAYPATESAITPWSLVVVGDSIPYNSPDDCRNCTGFVDRYAAAITETTGHPVNVRNLSQHNGLQIDGLLEELKSDSMRREALANADIIVVGIAHNDTAWIRNDDPCDGPTGDNIEWSKFNQACAAAAAELFRPRFESVFAQIVALRSGKPTIFRTINRYNDWIGLPGVDISPEGTNATREVLDAWNAMLCKAAQTNGFTCADIYRAFNGPDGLTPAPALIAKDTIHPSDKGNEVIARVLADLGYAPLMQPGSAMSVPVVATSPTKPAPAATPNPQLVAEELDKILQELTSANQFSGSFLVAQNGQVILSRGYGLADREKKTPITVETKFRIGPMTKQFTAMAIMLLQVQDKLNVLDQVCIYLANCPEAWKSITIHQLLTQTSGIPDHSDAFIGQDITSSASLERLIAEVKKLPLASQPGEQYANNNHDYILLGKVIEAASGETYEVFLQKNIFGPLQMSSSGFDPNRADVAIGYLDKNSVADPINLWVEFSSAGLYSTVEDLYRYDQALYTDKLVPQEALNTMFTSYVESERDGFGFGYGWYVGLDKPHNIKLPGGINGFDSTFRRYLDDKVTIIYLTNEQDYDNVTIANWVQKMLLGK
jgi:CubicO group peptidase (beta-lactamase class C family)/lysophospholipase L1-like esterase